MNFITHEYRLTVLEAHLDTFGHMNNATYLQILEEARWDFITKNGFGLEVILKSELGPVVLDVNLKFLKEIKNREELLIQSYVKEYGSKVGVIVQKIMNQKNELAAEAYFTFGLFDTKLRKLVPPTPEWLKAVGGQQ